MTNWTYYPVFIGTAISVITLTHLVISNRDKIETRTLSELVTVEQHLLLRFRNILLICGMLFAITMFAYIVPRVHLMLAVLVLSLMIIIGELLAGLIPAHKNTIKVHEVLAGMMATGMLLLSYVFWFEFRGGFALAELALALFMTVLAGLLISDTARKRFITYELLFIFSSHASIVLATVVIVR